VRVPYALYYASSPAPENAVQEALNHLVAVHFSSVNDALHAAALVLRGGQHVWLIDGPGVRYEPKEIEERCRPILAAFKPPR
jgi:hypothetical protein